MVQEYFKKEMEEGKILIQINPESLHGIELLVDNQGNVQKTKRAFDSEIYDDLKEDAFEQSSPLEFNLYLKGLGK